MTRHRMNGKRGTFRLLIWIQATYVLLTALWPIADIHSFMEVTGPKTDVWLVKTVGALLIPISICLYSYLFTESDRRPAIILGGLTAIAFVCVDCYYAFRDVISDVYLADAAVELVFFFAWIYIAVSKKKTE